MSPERLPIRGYLLHITHYDPTWCKVKEKEAPFDLEVGLAAVDAMAEAGLNLLILDCKDGVRYATHPELARHYTQPMDVVRALRERCRQHGIETAAKLNFSQSGVHQHNHWFRPHNDLFDSAEYWQRAFQIIDELIAAVQPRRFFHIGMDEDHWRSYEQYVAAIKTLYDGLAERGLRTLIWNDSACGWPQADIHKAKSLYAEEQIPKDIIQVLWDYSGAQPEILQRIRDRGFELWAAPGGKRELVTHMRDALLDCGGTGILLTRWQPCVAANRDAMLRQLQTCGPACL
jgi:hypothetical protein